MGKGSNLQKKQAARAKHEKEANKPQGGGGQAGKASRTGANAPKVYCHICRTEFMASQSNEQLQGHVDNKHPKNTFADCFPERA
ncbi:hypothetical protein BLSTO_05754 [Blastocystis sp. subtype 1]